MNKKAVIQFLPILIIIGVVVLINIVGITTFTYKLSHSNWLWIILIIGMFVLFKQMNKK